MASVRPDFRVPSDLPETLPVLPLRRGVLLPAVTHAFGVGRARSMAALQAAKQGYVLVAVQREPVEDPVPSDLLPTAVLARIVEPARGSPAQVVVQGICRVWLQGFPSSHPFLEARWAPADVAWPDTAEAEGALRAVREAVEANRELFGPQASNLLNLHIPPGLFLDAVAAAVDGPEQWKREMMATVDPMLRAEKVITHLTYVREVMAAQESIRHRVEADAKDLQKEALLRRQLKAIQDELGEGGNDDELARLKEKLAAATLPDEVRAVVDRELKRLERLGQQGPERSVALDWLERIADMPWGKYTAVDLDLAALEEALDRSHHGLDEVKRQVVEHLSVRKLAGHGRADVLLLVGPPGVGKTSIGQAIADASGRKLVRVALGGVRDEAELRGHRRTYIGSRPGRLVEGIRRAGAQDPVVLLDEVDKLGKGWQGDPAAALLEILDPEQNHAFVDHYLEVPFDLSKVLFVATANDISQVPDPLRDRMEVLEIAGYTREEKVVIARNHLLSKLAENTGVSGEEVEIPDEVIREVIAGWTREAGVRQLQRALGRVFRAAAVEKAKGKLEGRFSVRVEDLPKILGRRKLRDEEHDAPNRPGVATGLAWTPVGGDVLYVEASTLPGKGQLMLTGQLGDVMKESARAALTYVLSHTALLGVPENVLEGRDVHVHVPAGAVPKDGPSAGVTLFTALASLLSQRPVRADVAMTGEATLRGRVLPVGGIKAKVLAAHRRGIRTVILPRANEGDIEDVPADVRAEMTFILVSAMEEVLEAALLAPVEEPTGAVIPVPPDPEHGEGWSGGALA